MGSKNPIFAARLSENTGIDLIKTIKSIVFLALLAILYARWIIWLYIFVRLSLGPC